MSRLMDMVNIPTTSHGGLGAFEHICGSSSALQTEGAAYIYMHAKSIYYDIDPSMILICMPCARIYVCAYLT
jgi:hypothetical protein